MKYMILLEGTSEKALVDLIIENKLFKIHLEDMIDERPFLNRQIDGSLLVMIRQLPSDEKISIIRIGDKMTDKLKIPNDIKKKVSCVEKYATLPEFEILLIINEGLYREYDKVKSKKKPKIFAKEKIKFNGKKYNNTYKWINSYFSNVDIKKLLLTYKQVSKHVKNDKYLVDLVL